MSKYERLFSDIVSQTESGTLNWKQIGRRVNIEIFAKPGVVFDQFAAEFTRGGATYSLTLVEKMVHDLDRDFPKYETELFVMDAEGELVVTLSDAVIDRHALIRFAKDVSARSDKTIKLFETYE